MYLNNVFYQTLFLVIMMKKYVLCLLIMIASTACKRDENVDFRQEMRNFVIAISRTAKQQKQSFVVIPQNGIELVTLSEDSNGDLAASYLAAIDGHGQEDFCYGYN